MNLFKKVLAGIVCIGCIALGGCGQANTADNTVKGDADFLKIASKAINKRWDEQDKLVEDEKTYEKTQKILEEETRTLEDAKAKIQDANLLKDVENYIAGNKKQIESLKTNDLDLEYKYIEESEALRKPALINMVDNFGLVINENNKQTYKDFKAIALVINKENDAKTFAEKLASEIKFEVTKEYDWSTCKTTLENTSDFNYEYIYYKVQFKDEEGVVVDTSSLGLDNFTTKSKQKTEVSTDKTYKTIEVTLDHFSLKE